MKNGELSIRDSIKSNLKIFQSWVVGWIDRFCAKTDINLTLNLGIGNSATVAVHNLVLGGRGSRGMIEGFCKTIDTKLNSPVKESFSTY